MPIDNYQLYIYIYNYILLERFEYRYKIKGIQKKAVLYMMLTVNNI